MNPWNLTESALHEPWRLWTSHLAHHGWRHAADNSLALLIPLLLLSWRQRGQLLLWLLILSPLLGLALLPWLEGGSFEGLSGLACAAWAYVGLRLSLKEDSFAFGAAMLGLLALKFMVEAMTGCGLLAHAGRWQNPTAAHFLGTLLGLMAGGLDATLLRLRHRTQMGLRRLVLVLR